MVAEVTMVAARHGGGVSVVVQTRLELFLASEAVLEARLAVYAAVVLMYWSTTLDV